MNSYILYMCIFLFSHTHMHTHTHTHAHTHTHTHTHTQDNSHLLSGCNDKILRVFDLTRLDSAPQQLQTGKSAVKSAVWAKDPHLFTSCCEDREIKLVDCLLFVAHSASVKLWSINLEMLLKYSLIIWVVKGYDTSTHK